jgi:hypothetical protein
MVLFYLFILHFKNIFEKKFIFFFSSIFFGVFLYYFNVLISKIILKILKILFYIFLNKNHFINQSQLNYYILYMPVKSNIEFLNKTFVVQGSGPEEFGPQSCKPGLFTQKPCNKGLRWSGLLFLLVNKV